MIFKIWQLNEEREKTWTFVGFINVSSRRYCYEKCVKFPTNRFTAIKMTKKRMGANEHESVEVETKRAYESMYTIMEAPFSHVFVIYCIWSNLAKLKSVVVI